MSALENSFDFTIVTLFFILAYFGWNWLLHTFANFSSLSQVMHFELSAGKLQLKCGLSPHLRHILMRLLAVNFSIGFRKVY